MVGSSCWTHVAAVCCWKNAAASRHKSTFFLPSSVSVLHTNYGHTCWGRVLFSMRETQVCGRTFDLSTCNGRKEKSCRILLWVDLWWNDWTNIYSKLPPPQETFSLLKYVQNSGICFSKLWFPTTEEKSSCRSSEEAGRTLCATVTTFWKTEDPFGLIRTLF